MKTSVYKNSAKLPHAKLVRLKIEMIELDSLTIKTFQQEACDGTDNNRSPGGQDP
jgi:hypothetical protein